MLIAAHEQVNALHPSIYMDPMLKKTMDSSPHMNGANRSFIAPPFKVAYSAQPTTDHPNLKTVFDTPESVIDQFKKPEKSLPNKRDRMEFVGKIAGDFNKLMASDEYFPGIVTALQTVRRWKDA